MIDLRLIKTGCSENNYYFKEQGHTAEHLAKPPGGTPRTAR